MGNHLIKGWSNTQGVLALSSGEAEYYGMVKGASVAIGFRNMLSDLGVEVGIKLLTDASAAKGIASRRGIGKVRHIEVSQLWLQAKVTDGTIHVSKVKGTENWADAFTKPKEGTGIAEHLDWTGQQVQQGRHDLAPQTETEDTGTFTEEQEEDKEQAAAAMLQQAIFSVSNRQAIKQNTMCNASNRNTTLFALTGNPHSPALAMPQNPLTTGKSSGAAASTTGNSQQLVVHPGTQELVMQMGQVGTATLLGQPLYGATGLPIKAPPARRPNQQDTVELRVKAKAKPPPCPSPAEAALPSTRQVVVDVPISRTSGQGGGGPAPPRHIPGLEGLLSWEDITAQTASGRMEILVDLARQESNNRAASILEQIRNWEQENLTRINDYQLEQNRTGYRQSAADEFYRAERDSYNRLQEQLREARRVMFSARVLVKYGTGTMAKMEAFPNDGERCARELWNLVGIAVSELEATRTPRERVQQAQPVAVQQAQQVVVQQAQQVVVQPRQDDEAARKLEEKKRFWGVPDQPAQVNSMTAVPPRTVQEVEKEKVLPQGWNRHWDHNMKHWFHHNPATGESRWEATDANSQCYRPWVTAVEPVSKEQQVKEADAELAMQWQAEECQKDQRWEEERKASETQQAREIDQTLNEQLAERGASSSDNWNQGKNWVTQERGRNLATSVARHEPDRLPGFAPPMGSGATQEALERIKRSAITGETISAADHDAAPWMEKSRRDLELEENQEVDETKRRQWDSNREVLKRLQQKTPEQAGQPDKEEEKGASKGTNWGSSAYDDWGAWDQSGDVENRNDPRGCNGDDQPEATEEDNWNYWQKRQQEKTWAKEEEETGPTPDDNDYVEPVFYDPDEHPKYPKFETNEDCSVVALLKKGTGPFDSGAILSPIAGKLYNLDWYYSEADLVRLIREACEEVQQVKPIAVLYKRGRDTLKPTNELYFTLTGTGAKTGQPISRELMEVVDYCNNRAFYIIPESDSPRVGFIIKARIASKFLVMKNGNHPDSNAISITDSNTGVVRGCRRKFAYGPLYGDEIWDDVLLGTAIRCTPWLMPGNQQGLEALSEQYVRNGLEWEKQCDQAKGAGKGIKPQTGDPEFSIRASGKHPRSIKFSEDDAISIRRKHSMREYKGPSQSGYLRTTEGAGLSETAQALVYE